MSLKALWLKYKELILYMVFGAGTTLVNIVGYFVFSRVIPTGTVGATTIAWILSVIFAYVTNKLWVFNSHVKGVAILKEAAAFFGCRLASYFIDVTIMHVFVDLMHYPDMWVKIFSNVFVVIFNYVFSKFFIFKKEGNENE